MRKFAAHMLESGSDFQLQVLVNFGDDKYVITLDATLERVQ